MLVVNSTLIPSVSIAFSLTEHSKIGDTVFATILIPRTFTCSVGKFPEGCCDATMWFKVPITSARAVALSTTTSGTYKHSLDTPTRVRDYSLVHFEENNALRVPVST